MDFKAPEMFDYEDSKISSLRVSQCIFLKHIVDLIESVECPLAEVSKAIAFMVD